MVSFQWSIGRVLKTPINSEKLEQWMNRQLRLSPNLMKIEDLCKFVNDVCYSCILLEYNFFTFFNLQVYTHEKKNRSLEIEIIN